MKHASNQQTQKMHLKLKQNFITNSQTKPCFISPTMWKSQQTHTIDNLFPLHAQAKL